MRKLKNILVIAFIVYAVTTFINQEKVLSSYKSQEEEVVTQIEEAKEYQEELPDSEKEVDFDSVLFGESIDETKIFNYCPAILIEDDVMHIWYCTNKTSGVIMDHIGYRTGTKTANGKWKFSEQQIVLAPTPGTWDGRHTCDPAVIKGEFKMQGETYNYLMSYLGCVTEDYSKNETGIAVSKTPAGPWIKVDSLNPIVPWGDPKIFGDGTDRNGFTSWGTGMPALISIDGKGEVLLFFQTSSRGTGIQRWDLSDLDNPQVKFDVARNNNGILKTVRASKEQLEMDDLLKEINDDEITPGCVVKTDPDPGTTCNSKTSITIWISKGVAKAVMPELYSMTIDEAQAALEEAGLEGEYILVASTSNSDLGRVLEQEYQVGDELDKGTIVKYKVGGIEIPESSELVGKSYKDVIKELEKLGVKISLEYTASTAYNKDLVVKVKEAGNVVLMDSTVTVTVSTGPGPSEGETE